MFASWKRGESAADAEGARRGASGAGPDVARRSAALRRTRHRSRTGYGACDIEPSRAPATPEIHRLEPRLQPRPTLPRRRPSTDRSGRGNRAHLRQLARSAPARSRRDARPPSSPRSHARRRSTRSPGSSSNGARNGLACNRRHARCDAPRITAVQRRLLVRREWARRVHRLEPRLPALARSEGRRAASRRRAGSPRRRQAGRRPARELQEAADAAACHARPAAAANRARPVPRSGEGSRPRHPRRRREDRQAHPGRDEGSADPSAAQLHRSRHRDARGTSQGRQARRAQRSHCRSRR